MFDLERELVAVGASLDAPTDPLLATRVRDRLATPARPRRRGRWLAAVLATIAVVSLETPVVADWLRAGGVELRQSPPPTTVSPGPLSLGRRSSLAAVDASVPSVLGAPDEVWVDEQFVWLAYRARPSLPATGASGYGALLGQATASLPDDVLATKFVEPTTRVQRVTLGAGRAYWVEGVHYFAMHAASGDMLVDRLRLADNVLLWELGDRVFRLESSLGLDESLRIARSVS